MPTNLNGPASPMVIVQAETKVVVHHDDRDLLLSIARDKEMMDVMDETEGAQTAAILHELPAPLMAMLVAEFDSEKEARKFILIATEAALSAEECIKLDPRGFDGGDSADAVRRILREVQ